MSKKSQEYPVVWLQTATCTGCSVSVLNTVSPNIKSVLVDEVIPGTHVNLVFQATVMAGAGELAIHAMEDTWHKKKGGYVLVVEGDYTYPGQGPIWLHRRGQGWQACCHSLQSGSNGPRCTGSYCAGHLRFFRRFGLANSVISGVNEIFKQNDRIIVMEDDIITSPSFLSFMNKALAFYQDDKSIYSISGYPYPINIPNKYQKDIFILYRSSSWGWGTWKDRWEKVDWEVKGFSTFISDKNTQKLFDRGGQDLTQMLKAQMKGKIDSWAIRWSYAHFKNNAYCLYPVVPLCKNIGTDKSGTHSSSSKKLNVELRESDRELILDPSRHIFNRKCKAR